MNQQRSRRYRSAKEIEDKREEEEKMRHEWTLNGKRLPPKKPPTWDHNVITPGTPFMHRLSKFLRSDYYAPAAFTPPPFTPPFPSAPPRASALVFLSLMHLPTLPLQVWQTPSHLCYNIHLSCHLSAYSLGGNGIVHFFSCHLSA